MQRLFRLRFLLFLWTALLLGEAFAQQIIQSRQTWSAEVIRPSGLPVIPLFDGWYPNDDGTRTLCFGYFNMNTEQSLDVPLGDTNYLSDERFDALLPTHFDPLPPRYRHVFCAFTVTVPADFGGDEKIVWNITSAGQTLSTPGHIMPAFVLDEPASNGRGNIAPLVRLDADGDGVRGRTGIHHDGVINTRVGIPVTLSAWIEHPAEEVWVGWSHHRGPGEVSFEQKEYQIKTADSSTQVQVNFSEPGDYVVRMQTIDSIAAFEFYCCHTNAYFHINVSN